MCEFAHEKRVVEGGLRRGETHATSSSNIDPGRTPPETNARVVGVEEFGKVSRKANRENVCIIATAVRTEEQQRTALLLEIGIAATANIH